MKLYSTTPCTVTYICPWLGSTKQPGNDTYDISFTPKDVYTREPLNFEQAYERYAPPWKK